MIGKNKHSKRQLADITTNEVSFVDKPANKRPFLILKRDESVSKAKKVNLEVSIKTDNTVKGTKILVNGDEIKDMTGFYFSFHEPSGDYPGENVISCSYSKVVDNEDGFKHSETFYLAKGEFKMDKELLKQLTTFLGDDMIDVNKAALPSDEEVESVTKALECIEQYKADCPEEFIKAINAVAMSAGLRHCQQVTKADSKDDDAINKAGAKLSKETLAKVKSALAALEALKSILPADKTEKSEEVTSDLAKKLETLVDALQVNKSEDKAEDNELTKTLKTIAERIDKIEKTTGTKKSVEGQDDTEDDDDTVNKSGNKWPSFQTK